MAHRDPRHEEKLAQAQDEPILRVSEDERRQGHGAVRVPRAGRSWTGKELVDALLASGTGENKLRLARRHLRDNPGASATAMLECIARAGQRPAHEREPFGYNVYLGTLEKAKMLLDGMSLDDIARRAQDLAAAFGSQLADGDLRRSDVILQADEMPLTVPQELLQA